MPPTAWPELGPRGLMPGTGHLRLHGTLRQPCPPSPGRPVKDGWRATSRSSLSLRWAASSARPPRRSARRAAAEPTKEQGGGRPLHTATNSPWRTDLAQPYGGKWYVSPRLWRTQTAAPWRSVASVRTGAPLAASASSTPSPPKPPPLLIRCTVSVCALPRARPIRSSDLDLRRAPRVPPAPGPRAIGAADRGPSHAAARAALPRCASCMGKGPGEVRAEHGRRGRRVRARAQATPRGKDDQAVPPLSARRRPRRTRPRCPRAGERVRACGRRGGTHCVGVWRGGRVDGEE